MVVFLEWLLLLCRPALVRCLRLCQLHSGLSGLPLPEYSPCPPVRWLLRSVLPLLEEIVDPSHTPPADLPNQSIPKARAANVNTGHTRISIVLASLVSTTYMSQISRTTANSRLNVFIFYARKSLRSSSLRLVSPFRTLPFCRFQRRN